MYVRSHMTAPAVTVGPDEKLPAVREILAGRHFRHLPVVDGHGHLVGMVTDRDLRSAYPSPVMAEAGRQELLAQLAATPVSAIMSRDLVWLGLLSTLDDALFLLERHNVGALPVVDAGQRVVGIFSVRDLLAAYRTLFGVGLRGSSLIEIVDDGRPRILSTIIQALEERDIPFTRVVRAQGDQEEAGPGRIYIRVNTYNLRSVHAAVAEAGLRPVVAAPEPPAPEKPGHQG
ncbi:MAG: CBS domain-containing protein [Thermodesulfobacteriota bacterium]